MKVTCTKTEGCKNDGGCCHKELHDLAYECDELCDADTESKCE